MCLKKVAYRSPPPAPVRAPLALERPWERRAALQPLPRRRSRAASAELARTAPLAVARWLWCGDAGTSAGSTGLHNVRKRRSARLSLVLCSGELGGRSVVRRCRLPSVCCLRPPQPGPAPLALVPRGRVSTEVGRPRQQKQRVSANPPQRRKNWEESTKTRCRRCRSPCVLASSVPRRAKQPLPPPRPRLTPRLWQPQKRIRRNGAYVYHVVPKAFRWELANAFNASLVAKVLKGRGHL